MSCVIVKTKTRSKNSSSVVTRVASGGAVGITPGLYAPPAAAEGYWPAASGAGSAGGCQSRIQATGMMAIAAAPTARAATPLVSRP